MIDKNKLLSIMVRNSPKICHFLFELLFAGQVWIGRRSGSTCTSRSSFVDGKLLCIALKLACKVFDPLL